MQAFTFSTCAAYWISITSSIWAGRIRCSDGGIASRSTLVYGGLGGDIIVVVVVVVVVVVAILATISMVVAFAKICKICF